MPGPLPWFYKDNSQVFIPFRKQKYPLKYYYQGNKLLSKTVNQNHGVFLFKSKNYLPLSIATISEVRVPCKTLLFEITFASADF